MDAKASAEPDSFITLDPKAGHFCMQSSSLFVKSLLCLLVCSTRLKRDGPRPKPLTILSRGKILQQTAHVLIWAAHCTEACIYCTASRAHYCFSHHSYQYAIVLLSIICVLQVVSGRTSKAAGPFKEAMVFMSGGGNYLEYESLLSYASRSQPPKNILYGATDIIAPEAFAKQLADLGRRSSAGNT